MSEVSFYEGPSGYHADSIFDHKIEHADLSLTAEENFKRKFSKIKEFFSRENILKFGIMTGEVPIPIDSTHGNIAVSTIDKEQISKRMEKLSQKERDRIGYIHISTIQILIKSTFMKGIDAPLEISLRDSRILDKNQAIIAQGMCNLKYGKIKFDVHLQLGLSLQDIDLSKSIIFQYGLENPKLMKEGNHPFTIYYRINYALSNSHHSIDFIGKDRIHIDELFKPMVTLESPIFNNLARKRCSLIKVDKDQFEETETKPLFKSQSFRLAPPKRDFEISKLQRSVEDLSLRLQIIDKKI
ncbi:uncharacterized protein LOC123901488 [Trifolium pratense]|uniref:uncharacterized protein LOC123901488 n=1 Tax=Trifolium pratense TaxID=57577 RepID=UPI001E692439|nr:uncharacterized protein LOC123901488 [Trifolium pratense]